MQVIVGAVDKHRGQRAVVCAVDRAGLVGDRAGADEHIVLHQHRGADGVADKDEGAARAVVIDEGIVDDVQVAAGIGRAFFAIGQHGRIIVAGRLLDHVADHVGGASVGQVDLVAGLVYRTGKPAVDDGVDIGARLQVVADLGVMRVAVAEDQAVDVADVQVVGITVAIAVVGEFGVFDNDVGDAVVIGQDAVLIVMQVAAAQRQVAPVKPDGRAVLVGYLGAVHFDIFDHGAGADHDPGALAHRVGAVRIDLRTAVDAADGQVVRIDAADVAVIAAACIDFNQVAVGGRGKGAARCGVSLARTDGERGGGGQSRQHQSRQGRSGQRGASARQRSLFDEHGFLSLW